MCVCVRACLCYAQTYLDIKVCLCVFVSGVQFLNSPSCVASRGCPVGTLSFSLSLRGREEEEEEEEEEEDLTVAVWCDLSFTKGRSRLCYLLPVTCWSVCDGWMDG